MNDGARPKKISVTLGVPEWRGKEIYDTFWEENWALAKVRDALNKYCDARGGKYIKGLDGRLVPVRSEHARLNALFQSAGIICMKKAMVLMEQRYRDNPLAHGVVRYHDEEQWEVHQSLVRFKKFLTEEEAKGYIDSAGRLLGAVQHHQGTWFRAYSEIGEAGVQSIRDAGVALGLRVPLDGEYKVGKTWASTH